MSLRIPTETQWCRVEELSAELASLAPEQVSERLAQLAQSGEPRTVLTLLGAWHALPPPSPTFAPGLVIGGHYTLQEKLGEGGMSSVWRATQRTVEREVALKIVHPGLITPAWRQRSLDEVRALGQLDHPGIVRIFDAGFHTDPSLGTLPYFAMELVEGLPLHVWATRHRADRRRLLDVVSAICEAVQAAHDRRIVHRDLKPANILVRQHDRPVVLDFGIARLVGTSGDDGGVFSGTPQYAAPEQHLGRDLDFRSGESVDVYALGAILFELVAGRRLFEFPRGSSIAEMRREILEGHVLRLASVVPDCPPGLDELVARAVRRDPADRFYSVAALGRAVSRLATSLSAPTQPAQPWQPAPGSLVPGTQWLLLERLGEGGAGEVWLGQHSQLGERRVFKFCSTEEKARTLKREFTLFRLLKERVGRHPHFVQLHEVSLDEPPWYLMMDDTGARDLESWTSAFPGGLAALPEETRIEIVAQAAEALQTAHDAGILHRDIKPANLLIRTVELRHPAPPLLHLLIADFGIGLILIDRLQAGDARLGFTRTVSHLQRTDFAGTMIYLAPEVLEGQPATVRSDIYSLGVVFWQLLVGNLRAALDPTDWPTPIADPLLRADLQRCLAGAPEKRWSSAGELAASLRALADRRATESRRRADIEARERRAYRRGVAIATSVATAFIVTLALFGWYAFDRAQAATLAQTEARAKALSSSVNELEKLALILSPDRGRRAADILQQFTARTDDERRALADAYTRVLELDDWSVTRSARPSAVTSAALESLPDPTGRFALRRLPNALVDLADTHQTRLRGPYPADPEAPVVLALSAGAHRAAIASGTRIRILHGATGGEESLLTAVSPVSALAWNSTGTELAVGLADSSGEALIEVRRPPHWDVASRLAAPDHPLPIRPAEHLAYSPDDARLAHWTSHSLHLLIWDLRRQEIAALAYHPAPVRSAIWTSPSQVYSAAADAYLYRWDLGDGWTTLTALDHPVARYPSRGGSHRGHNREWSHIALFPRGDILAAADEVNGEVFCFDLTTGQTDLRFAAGPHLAALRTTREGVVLHHTEGPVGEVRRVRSRIALKLESQNAGPFDDFDLAPGSDGLLIAAGGMGGVALFDSDLNEHPGPSESARTLGVRFLPDRTLLSSSRFGDLSLLWAGGRLTNAPVFSNPALLPRHPNTPARIALGAQGQWIATARARRIVWSDFSGTNAVELACDPDAPPECLSMSPSGNALAWVDRTRRAWICRWKQPSALDLQRPASHIVFLTDRACAVTSATTRGIEILDVSSHRPLPVRVDGLDLSQATAMDASSHANLAAVALRDGGIELGCLSFSPLALATWRPLVRLATGDSGELTALRFAGNGRWLGAITDEGQLRLWNVGTLLAVLSDTGCLPSWFNHDSRLLASDVPNSPSHPP